MKLVGLMLARNEDWIIEFSLRGALRWCDAVLVLMDRCTDETGPIVVKIANEFPGRVVHMVAPDSEVWNEMHLRQATLVEGRKMGGTHFAIVDADEAMTSNLLPDIRGFFERLRPGELLELPMLAARSLTQYHDDNTVWSKALITLGFCDMPALTWRPGGDGYQHHNRPPFGNTGRAAPLNRDKARGGVLHFQFANQRRLVAKHVLYRLVDHLRWPGRETVAKLNWKYDQALDLSQAQFTYINSGWWMASPDLINANGVPYQEQEIRNLLEKHGRGAFAGLDLKGF